MPAKRPHLSATTMYAALLRGINVGGKNMLPMPKLAELFAATGCERVRTYIQSGNVIFAATPECAASLPSSLPPMIAKKFGFAPPVVIRSAKELAQVASASPYPVPTAQGHALHVLFLATRPGPNLIAGLDPDRSPGDRYTVRGSDIYLHLTTGAADTKLTNAYFDSKLATVSTGRNWRTVLKLVEMTASEK